MMNSSRSRRMVGGMIGGKDRMACQQQEVVTSASPALFLQFSLIFILTRSIYFRIKPLRQSIFTAQVLAGIILGPSLLSTVPAFATIFSPEAKLVLETFANFGFMFHAFILGLQFDIESLKTMGRRPTIIGFWGTIIPLVMGTLVCRHIVRIPNVIESELIFGLYFMTTIDSMTSFLVTTTLLTELNILNSEVGRLAASTSLVSDFCGLLMGAFISNIIPAITNSIRTPLLSLFTISAFYGFMFFGFRPLVIRLASSYYNHHHHHHHGSINLNPDGNRNGDGDGKAGGMSQSHFIGMLTVVLGFAFVADVIGQRWVLSAFIFGLCLPTRPPFNSALVQKLSTMVSGMILPIYCANGGLRTDIWSIRKRSSMFIQLVIAVGYLGKFIGTILPALYFDIPFRDATCLALIMCSKGIVEISAYSLWMDNKVLNKQVFALLIISMISVIGVSAPIVSHLYDPSRRYMKKNKSNLRHNQSSSDLRLLVCIHGEENVPTIINLLEASNPTRTNPITVFVLQVKELHGLTTSVLAPVNHRNNNNHASSKLSLTPSERIVNAFNQVERHSQGPIAVQHFTVNAPFASMHNDICNLALDKKTSIVIVPYHKQQAIDGSVEATFPSIRFVNQNVILKAPCSVGVLIDRSITRTRGQFWYRIIMLYVGGADDREALEYATRMAGHPNTSLTVIWIKSITNSNERQDIEVMRGFQSMATGNEKKMVYREENVEDGIGTTQVIRKMEEVVDLFIVGRRHDPHSPVTLGLTEWNECPELGIIGDMLTRSDFRFSVLVIQQG